MRKREKERESKRERERERERERVYVCTTNLERQGGNGGKFEVRELLEERKR